MNAAMLADMINARMEEIYGWDNDRTDEISDVIYSSENHDYDEALSLAMFIATGWVWVQDEEKCFNLMFPLWELIKE